MTKIITTDDAGQTGSSSARTAYLEKLLEELRERKRSGKGTRWEDFSFDQSQESLKDIPGNFSDAVEDERNA